MVLDSYRKQGDVFLLPLSNRLRNVNPNTLSWLALLFAVLTGYLFFLAIPLTIFLGALTIIMSSLFDALDGRVAKLTGKACIQGDFLDHTLDRYADIFIIGGIAFGPLSRLSLGFLALVGILMTSYMGTQAHAVGVGRNYGGIAGRADRLLLLIMVPVFYVLFSYMYRTDILLLGVRLSMFEILMIWFAVSGNLTALHRGLLSWKALSSNEK